jgi:uncharacterized repeat protein (TIGR01451 family)
MTEQPHTSSDSPGRHQGEAKNRQSMWWKISYWVVGLGSTIWLLLRSGSKPKRITYPCQQVAAANSLGFLAYLATILGSTLLFRRLRRAFTPGTFIVFVMLVLSAGLLQSSVSRPVLPVAADSPELPAWISPSAVSNVFAVPNVPEPQYSLDGGDIPSGVSVDDALRDAGVDALVDLMEVQGDHFYRTSSHPDGLFASDDVILIKVSSQWDGRNNTNTDIVKGVIYRLVQHPDGFTGAVIVAENPQSRNADWYYQGNNNSQFQNQSYQEVVQAFSGEGYHACISDWRSIRSNYVNDYDAGNNDDGYVLDAGDYKLSYPKFSTSCNGMDLKISTRYGLWNGASFDNTRLKMINMPVLKRHNAAWGTISVKNYLGFITISDGIGRWSGVSEKHCWLTGPSDNGYTCAGDGYSPDYGLVGRQMARIRRADLNIVDAIWVNPLNNLGAGSLEQDVLLASRDPFAVDYYASEYILYPLIYQFGYTSEPEQAQASHHGGWFRNVQMRNVARLRAEGVTDTINMSDSMTRQQELDQFNVYVAGVSAPVGPPFEESYKEVSHPRIYGGQEITYTVVLYEDTSATLTLTDTIPSPLSYVPGSADIMPSWKGPVQDAGSIRWSGVVTSGQPVTLTFRALVPETSATLAVVNRVEISRDGAEPIERQALSILNPLLGFLPQVSSSY